MKVFKTIDEQIAILKQRGLIIDDEEHAKKYLLSQNYYNLNNGYAKFFPRENEIYVSNTSFDEITSLYIFERDIKQTILLAILEAETHLRAIFSYRFSETFKDDPYAYLNINSFEKKNTLSIIQTISSLSKTIRSYESHNRHSSIAHYIRVHGSVPIWVLVNYINFGELRHLLKYSTNALQNRIAKDFCEFIEQNIPNASEPFHPETLNSFLDNINDIRNICAHNNRLLGFRCHQSTKYWAPLHTKYNILPNDSRRSAYEIFLILQCFISKNEYAMLHNTLRKRFRTLGKKLRTIPINNILNELGFPNDWHINNNKLEQLKKGADCMSIITMKQTAY